MATYNIKNLAATLENINMTGSFDTDHATLDTAIPPATIGLYQLINKLISELVSIKNGIKTEEKRIQTVLAGDAHADAFTGSITDSTSGAGLKVANREAATAGTAGRGELAITVSTTFNKPAVYLGGATAGNLSEDALFELLQKITHIIFNITNNSVTANSLAVADPINVAAFSGNAA